ncbi:hypothetical protein AVEN_94196-1, partial [Araneus ventricosus]
QFAIPS